MNDQPRRYRRRGRTPGPDIWAWQVTAGNLKQVAQWCHGRVDDDSAVRPNRSMIPARPGDYVVELREGEYYTAVEDLFEMYHQLA